MSPSGKIRKLLETACPGRVSAKAALGPLTTWKIGGPADWLVEPGSLEELRHLIRVLGEQGLVWQVLGRGSNLLIADRGVRGVVILLGSGFSWIRPRKTSGPAVHLEIGAGTPLSRLVRYGLHHGFSGLEFLTGIPGSAGGGWAMNAGSQGRELRDLTISLTAVNAQGERVKRSRKDLPFGYRRLDLFPGEIIVSGILKVDPGERREIDRRARDLLARRKSTQPWREPSGGSIFKNPPGDFAGRLIDAAGCRGLLRGDAQVSEKHANFIINRGQARARDVLELMGIVRHRVRSRSGIVLEPEVRLWGCSLKALPAQGRSTA